MKIFDFSEGKKGKFLGEVSFGGTNGRWFEGKLLKKESVQIGRYEFNPPFRSIYEKENPITPEEFGVKAICYCCSYITGTGYRSYEWAYSADWDWVKANTKFEFEETKIA